MKVLVLEHPSDTDRQPILATHLIANGTDVRTVAGRLRHASPTMTLDVYAAHHRTTAAEQAAGQLIDKLLDAH